MINVELRFLPCRLFTGTVVESSNHCSYEFDPVTWKDPRGPCAIDGDDDILTETADGRVVWQCPHEAHATVNGERRCQFHLSSDADSKPDPDTITDEFLRIVNGDKQALDNDGPRPAQFIGATFESLTFGEDQIGDSREVDLRHARIRTADWSETTLNIKRLDARRICVEQELTCTDTLFDGDVDFRTAKFGGDTRFDGVKFDRDARFGRAEFDNKAWFAGAEFSEYAGFKETEFDGKAWFGVAKFSAYAGFRDAEFGGDADFSVAEFGGKAGFKMANFGGEAGFDEAKFNLEARFEEAKFGGEAQFRETDFSQEAWFDEAEFSRKARFGETWQLTAAKFGDHVRFDEAEFEKKAEFNRTEFSGYARFNEAKFSQDAEFHEATFGQSANFSSAEFDGPAAFVGASFADEAEFSADEEDSTSLFKDEADFSDITAEGPVRFVDRHDTQSEVPDTFLDSVDFSGAHIPNAEFSNVSFSKSPTFDDADLTGSEMSGLSLDQASFEDADLVRTDLSESSIIEGNFNGAILERAALYGTDFRNTKLYGVRLADAHISDHTDFGIRDISDQRVSHIPFRGPLPAVRYDSRNPESEQYSDAEDKRGGESISDHTRAASVYAEVQRVAETNGASDLTSRCFRWRKDMLRKRYLSDEGTGNAANPIRWTLAWISNLIARYGDSPWRVVYTSIGTITLFTILYSFSGGVQLTSGDSQPLSFNMAPTVSVPHCVEILAANFYFSFVTFTTLGYGDIRPSGPVARFLASAESFVGAALLALLVAVLARRLTR